MTGMQVLQMLGEMRPGSLEPVQQVQGWLYALEARIRAEVTGEEMPAPEAFTMEQELSVPAPYAHLYAWYLCAQADLARGEAARYNNSVTVFNDLYEGYTAWHTRTHLPAQKHHVTASKDSLPFPRSRAIIVLCNRWKLHGGLAPPYRLQKQRKGVRRMDDYQILMILLTIAGLLLAAYKAGKDDRK